MALRQKIKKNRLIKLTELIRNELKLGQAFRTNKKPLCHDSGAG